MTDIHHQSGPVLFTQAATHVLIHATDAEYPSVRAAIATVADVITSRDGEPCPAVGAHGCRWWALVLGGHVDPADIRTAYLAAVATNN
jgi:hypothetical protein